MNFKSMTRQIAQKALSGEALRDYHYSTLGHYWCSICSQLPSLAWHRSGWL